MFGTFFSQQTLACPSQFLCKNEGKFIIYTVFVETWRETALIAEKLPI